MENAFFGDSTNDNVDGTNEDQLAGSDDQTTADVIAEDLVLKGGKGDEPCRVVLGMTFLGVARVMTSWKAVPEMINL